MSLEITRLGFSYCTRRVLTDVSFHVGRGELLAVMGPNGVGKTTLFRCILGLHRHYTGQIRIGGRDAADFSPRELAHEIAYIPQIHAPAFAFSVRDMVLMGTAHGLGSFSSPGKKEQEAAEAAMQRLGILHLAGRNYTHLSGGEQQLVLIARALTQNARILLMDEPTASLDYGNQLLVLSYARTLASEGYTVLLSTHNPQHALWYADRALALYEGGVAAFGSPQEVLEPGLIQKLYGIRTEFIDTTRGQLIAPLMEGQMF